MASSDLLDAGFTFEYAVERGLRPKAISDL